MATFLQGNGVQHTRSAPYHPSTNGLAEKFVQNMKHALKGLRVKGHSFLLANWNTPHAITNASLHMKGELRTSFDLLKQIKSQVKCHELRTKYRAFNPGESGFLLQSLLRLALCTTLPRLHRTATGKDRQIIYYSVKPHRQNQQS